ncbi:MAG TPA: alpha/beta hydrolase [Intrasporangium sp.]|uniref:alpha/beta hydrolase n=1 Tax=Intrasporangium sp. TaxID=1925024 RepID=UPI002D78A7A0|nr:alpha/beta hydrolase [Intrasporangium sp.]HET7399438.1 alpha/beta hydrolase [Intrasporangium sp.]
MLNDPPPPALPEEAARPPRPGSRVRPLTAAVLALVLVAVVALAVWAWAARAGDPGGGPPAAAATSATPSPSRATTGAGAPGSATPPAPASTDHPPALATYYTQGLAWQPCSDNPKHGCATIKVPVDYAKPGGDTFDLALRKAPALGPGPRVGSLLFNPGGPGVAGLQYVRFSSAVFTKPVREGYDLIGFDPRGIGESGAVSCLTDADMDLLFADDPTPDTPAERTKLLADVDGVTSRCAAAGGERARHLSSTEVARDMDIIRALVGDPKLNFLGVSYGTFLGSLYADLFPQRVGRMVLDSAMSPNQTDLQEMDYDIQGFESSMDAFLAWCTPRSDCALGGDRARAKDRLVALLDNVDRMPLRTSRAGLPTVGEGWVGFAIFMALYSDTSWPTLNRGLTEALTKGTGEILVALASSHTERRSDGHYDKSSYLQAILPVRCADWPRTAETPALKAAQARAKAAHPLWARMTGELYDNCRAWPAPGRTPKGGRLAVGAGPILVVGNLRDPATPIGGTKQLAADLASGVLVTSDHSGHGAYNSGSSCIDDIVAAYLLRGTVPADGRAC